MLDTPPPVSDECFSKQSQNRNREISSADGIRELKIFLLELFERKLLTIDDVVQQQLGKTLSDDAAAILELLSPNQLSILNRDFHEMAYNFELWVGRTSSAVISASFDKSSPDELFFATFLMNRSMKRQKAEAKIFDPLIKRLKKNQRLRERKRSRRL